MATFHYYLDKGFVKGSNHLEVKKCIKEGKNYNQYLNRHDTPIYLWVTFEGGKYFKVHTREVINPKGWDFILQRPKRTMAGSASLQERLDEIKIEVLKRFRNLSPNVGFDEIKEMVKNVIVGKTPNFNKKTFIERYDEYLLDVKSRVKRLTYNKLKSFKNVFNEYLLFEEKNPRYFFLESINDDFDISFRDYLLDERGLVNNTAAKYYEILKTFLRYWKRKGVFKQTDGDFESYSIKRDATDIIVLNRFEINQLLDIDLSDDPSSEKVRDCFIFQIFTGQRYSDLRELKSSDLLLTVGGDWDWHLFQQKGNKPRKVIVPLLGEALRVVTKYELIANARGNKTLPVISNQKMNEKLKEICKLAGINQLITRVRYSGKNRIETTKEKWEFVTTHFGRRSFITLCLENFMPMHLVMEISGHTNARVITSSYAGKSAALLRSSLISAIPPREQIETGNQDEKTRRLLHS